MDYIYHTVTGICNNHLLQQQIDPHRHVSADKDIYLFPKYLKNYIFLFPLYLKK